MSDLKAALCCWLRFIGESLRGTAGAESSPSPLKQQMEQRMQERKEGWMWSCQRARGRCKKTKRMTAWFYGQLPMLSLSVVCNYRDGSSVIMTANDVIIYAKNVYSLL